MQFKVPKLKNDTKSGEIKKLEDAVRTVKGVTQVKTDAKNGNIDISYGADVKVSAIEAAAQKVGFELHRGS